MDLRYSLICRIVFIRHFDLFIWPWYLGFCECLGFHYILVFVFLLLFLFLLILFLFFLLFCLLLLPSGIMGSRNIPSDKVSSRGTSWQTHDKRERETADFLSLILSVYLHLSLSVSRSFMSLSLSLCLPVFFPDLFLRNHLRIRCIFCFFFSHCFLFLLSFVCVCLCGMCPWKYIENQNTSKL